MCLLVICCLLPTAGNSKAVLKGSAFCTCLSKSTLGGVPPLRTSHWPLDTPAWNRFCLDGHGWKAMELQLKTPPAAVFFRQVLKPVFSCRFFWRVSHSLFKNKANSPNYDRWGLTFHRILLGSNISSKSPFPKSWPDSGKGAKMLTGIFRSLVLNTRRG